MGNINNNKKVRLVFYIFLFLVPIIGFNNCSPMDNGGAGGGSSNNSSSGFGNLKASAEFFNKYVGPEFNSACASCHTDPRNSPIVAAGRQIYDFNKVREYIIRGTSALDNELVRILVNPSQHDAANAGIIGNLCSQGSAEGTCKILLQWWNVETFGDPDATSPFLAADELPGAALTPGRLSSVSLLGVVFGYARDPSNGAAKVDVMVYVDGPANGGGTFLGTITADDNGPGGKHKGHYFSYQLPSAYLDGQSRSFYVYSMDESDPNNLLASAPITERSYELKQAALDYFNSNLASFMQTNCSECHGDAGASYESRFYALASPTNPGGTWNASNNKLLDKASGNGHGGGSFCSNRNSGICANIQQLWSIQFQ